MDQWRSSAFADQPVLNAGFEYWRAQREGDALPGRAAIDPVRMPREILPFILWAEFLSAEGLIRYRLVGEEMVRRWGHNFRGETSADLFSGSYRQFMESTFATCFEHRRPVYTESLFRWDVGGWRSTKRLMLPFAEKSGGPPAHCLIVQTWPEIRSAADPRQMIDEVRDYQHTRLEIV